MRTRTLALLLTTASTGLAIAQSKLPPDINRNHAWWRDQIGWSGRILLHRCGKFREARRPLIRKDNAVVKGFGGVGCPEKGDQ